MALDRFRRSLAQAFDFRGDQSIRSQVDEDETAANLDFMQSRGQSDAVARHNAAASSEGEKIRRRALYGIPQRPAERKKVVTSGKVRL